MRSTVDRPLLIFDRIWGSALCAARLFLGVRQRHADPSASADILVTTNEGGKKQGGSFDNASILPT